MISLHYVLCLESNIHISWCMSSIFGFMPLYVLNSVYKRRLITLRLTLTD